MKLIVATFSHIQCLFPAFFLSFMVPVPLYSIVQFARLNYPESHPLHRISAHEGRDLCCIHWCTLNTYSRVLTIVQLEKPNLEDNVHEFLWSSELGKQNLSKEDPLVGQRTIQCLKHQQETVPANNCVQNNSWIVSRWPNHPLYPNWVSESLLCVYLIWSSRSQGTWGDE